MALSPFYTIDGKWRYCRPVLEERAEIIVNMVSRVFELGATQSPPSCIGDLDDPR